MNEEEAKKYDRQIRLWGVESQHRLMASHVLVAMLTPINVELCKNLILAGINVSIYDDRIVSEESLEYNFFVTPDDIGKNIADVCVQRLSSMNPNTKVAHVKTDEIDLQGALFAETELISHEVKTFVSQFTCACFAAEIFPVYILEALDEYCREQNIGLFATMTNGATAFMLTDLCTNTYSKVQGGGADQQNRIDSQIAFPSFKSALHYDLCALTRRTDPHFIALQCFLRWEKKQCITKRHDVLSDKDTNDCLEFTKTLIKDRTKDYVSHTLEIVRRICELCGVPSIICGTIMGGLAAQEIHKFIAKDNDALANHIVFDCMTNAAIVCFIPPTEIKQTCKDTGPSIEDTEVTVCDEIVG